jgi:signal transduction histidine kinase
MLASKTGELYRRLEGEQSFEDMKVRVPGGYGIQVPDDGVVFVPSLTQGVSRFRIVENRLVECGPPLTGVPGPMFGDQHGGGWMPTVSDGLHYYPSLQALCPPPGIKPSDTFSVANKASGATSDITFAALVDHEGNTWSTSGNSLDRYTRSMFAQVKVPHEITMAAIAADPGGGVWIGNAASDAMSYTEGVAIPSGVAPDAFAVSSAPGGGRVVAAATSGIWVFSPGVPTLLAPLPAMQTPSHPRAVYQAGDGPLVVATDDAVSTFEDGAWQKMPDIDKTIAIYGNGQGTLWFALAADNAFIAQDAGGLKRWTHADGVDVGSVIVITSGPGGTWIGGKGGVQLLKDGTFKTLLLDNAPVLSGVTGLVFDNDNNLWIHTFNGLDRITASDVARFASSPVKEVPAVVVAHPEDFAGHASQDRTLPSLVKGVDGRVWLHTMQSVMWFDPRELPGRTALSTPFITGLSAAGNVVDTTHAVDVPADQRSLVVSYTAPAITDAQLVKFQTRLAGFDDAWADQQGRREASYPKLPAGSYVFSVRASTDGVHWTANPPRLSVTVQPFFYETWWFKALCATAALVLVWLLARWEARRALRRYQARERIRTDERESIARDLHDTLLQRNFALVMQLEAEYRRTPEGDVRDRLERLAQSANNAVTEGRQRLGALRERLGDSDSLCVKLEHLGQNLAAEAAVHFQLFVEGNQRQLKAVARENLEMLVSEAITNAVRHGQASYVGVEVVFGRWQMRVAVKDDGEGIPPAVLASGGREGHFGIPGMFERARKLDARLNILRRTPKGTEICVAVPAWRIYARRQWRLFSKVAPSDAQSRG